MKHSASRALALLRAMNLNAASSVGELARATGISKPSVVRLLAILIEDGYVARAGKPGSYCLTREVRHLSAGFREDIAIARAAAPLMDALTARIDWPTTLGMFEQGEMVVRYSTIPASPLAWYRTTLYYRLPMLWSALGQVYLAFSSAAFRAALLSSQPPGAVGAAEWSEEHFERIRQRGHAVRMPTEDHPTFSLAVPVLDGSQVTAALSTTLYGRAMTVEEAARRYVPALREAADAISDQARVR